MPSSFSIYSSAPKTKIFFQFLWGILKGRSNGARPSQPILKNCQNGTFLPVDEIWTFFGQMTWFEMLWNYWKCHFLFYSKCVSGPVHVKKWINGIISKIPHKNSKILFCVRFLWISKKTGRQNWKVLTYSFMLKYSKVTVGIVLCIHNSFF